VPQLQRLVGNRAVVGLLGAVATVQRDGGDGAAGGAGGGAAAPVDPKLALLRSVPGAAPDPSHLSEGNKGKLIKAVAEEPFVTAETGTWHHVYPRNLLGRHLANISRYFKAVDPQVQAGSYGGATYNSMVTMAASFSMDEKGKLDQPANYYWKPGNGFLGIRSDRRADDPGSLVEHAKPKSMSPARYQRPRDWGKGLEKLSTVLGDLGKADSADTAEGQVQNLADFVTQLSWKLDEDPYRSVEVEGKDWERVNQTTAWGAQAKNYRLTK
jgi:hypothetical protein